MNYQTQQLRDLLMLLSGSSSQKQKRLKNRNKFPTMNFITIFIIFTNSKLHFDSQLKLRYITKFCIFIVQDFQCSLLFVSDLSTITCQLLGWYYLMKRS